MITRAIIVGWLACGPVQLRGRDADDPRDVVSMDLCGVVLRSEGREERIAWSDVKSVSGGDREGAARYMDLADQAWRARIRLERRDVAMALPLLEGLFERCKQSECQVTLLASAGLAHARLLEFDAAGAIRPMLLAAHLHELSYRVEASFYESTDFDPETGLMPALPPIFVPSETTAKQARILLDVGSSGDTFVSESLRTPTALLYQRALRLPRGTELMNDDLSERASSAERLVHAVVLATTSASAEGRLAGRKMLAADDHAHEGTWREAWSRLAIGRSFLLEPAITDKNRGLLELLEVPARFRDRWPTLAALGLSDAIAELRARGMTRESETLAQQLMDIDPAHPGLTPEVAIQGEATP